MLIKEQSTLYHSLKPIVYFNCLVGIGAYRQPDITDTTYLFMRLYTIVIIIINWAMTCIGLTELPNCVGHYHNTPMARKMYMILSYTNSFVALASPFLIWRQQKGLRDWCTRQMQILDDAFQTILGARNEYRKQYIRSICQLIAIALVTFVIAISDISWIPLNEQSLLQDIAMAITFYYPIIVILLFDLNFCTFVGYLGKKFRDLNASLLGLAGRPSAPHPGNKLLTIPRRALKLSTSSRIEDMPKAEGSINDKRQLLHEIRKAHSELCKLSQDVNLAFGIQNLMSMGISFVMVTGLTYTIYSALVWEGFKNQILMEIITSMSWTCIYIFKIWMVNHMCWSVSNEAEKTGAIIYELLETSVNEDLQREIQEFGVQMVQNPIRFTAYGFFTLDYTFVQGVIGSVTTYLVILIQMSPVSIDPTSNPPDLVNNRTEVLANQ